MKKQIFVVEIVVVLLVVGLSGCTTNENQQSNGNNNQPENGTQTNIKKTNPQINRKEFY